MSLQVEKLEKNMAKLTVEVPAEQFEAALKTSFQKNKNKFSIPGFRKGKAPQAMVEKMYGVGVLYDDAIDTLLDSTYADAVKESGLDIVSRPEIGIEQIEKGKTFIYTALVAVKPEVTLGEYKGVEVEKAKPEVTDADVEAELKKVQDQNSRMVNVEDRAVEDGDHTVIDFEGFVDGQPFEGGKSEAYPLVIGSHSFIDTFEEQLIGKNAGEACEVNVTFPEEYHASELAGKPAQFKVTVKEVKEKQLPELNDEFAGEVSEFETLAEYKEDIKKSLLAKKEADAKGAKEDAVIDAIVENAQMEIPDAMVETQQRQTIDEFGQRLQMQGLNLEQYFQFTGLTYEHMMEQVKPQAERRIKSRLVLEAVAAAENIEATEEDFDAEVKRMAEGYKMEADKIKELMGEAGKKQIMEDLAVRKAVDFVVGEAVEK